MKGNPTVRELERKRTKECETDDELRSESWVVLPQGLKDLDGGSLLYAVRNIDVDVGNVP